MAITPKSAYGTKLKIGNGATTEVFTEILGVRNGPNGPTESIDLIDVTSHSSPNSYRQVVPGFINPGEVTFDLVFDKADTQHALVITNMVGRIKTNFELERQDTGKEKLSFAAYISGGSGANPTDEAVSNSFTLSIDGAITRGVWT